MGIKEKVGTAAIELAKSENIQNKTADLLGMLFPYMSLTKKTVDLYYKEIENSNLPLETKTTLLLNVKSNFKKFKNQGDIAQIAINNAKEGTNFTSTSGIDEEFFDRFMDSAGYVSDDEMKVIWGKVLANEFENPGTTPRNMIRILSEFTPECAECFKKICSMGVTLVPVFEDGTFYDGVQCIAVYYSSNEELMRNRGISFDLLNELDTLGVIKCDYLSGYRKIMPREVDYHRMLIICGDEIVEANNIKNHSIATGNVLLTSAGEMLSRITQVTPFEQLSDVVRKGLNDVGVHIEASTSYYLENDTIKHN